MVDATIGVLARIVVLTAVYLLVLTSLDPGDILVGLAVSAAVVLAARRRAPVRDAPAAVSPLRRALGIPALLLGTLVDMVRGSLTVTRHCLGRPSAPGLVWVPMSAPNPGAAAAWGIRVGIAPDSIVVDLDEDSQRMLVHVLDSSDGRTPRMISLVLDVVGGLLLLVGLILVTISIYGVLRMPGTLNQLHAQGLATGPGVIAVLASSVATEDAPTITFAVLAIAFLVLSSPASSHAIARAAHDSRARESED